MKSLVVFLNELSLTPVNPLTPAEMLPYVLSTLWTMRAVRQLRRDVIIAGSVPLTGLLLGNGTHSLAEILRGDAHKDEWRFIKALAQASPWNAFPNPIMPGGLREVRFEETPAVAMLWAIENQSAIVSFPFPPKWTPSSIAARLSEFDEHRNAKNEDVQIPNLSLPEHVTEHAILLNEYGQELSPSSLVHEGNGFVIRMFFNDHNPPHFHVMLRKDISDAVARYAIRTLDCLSGHLAPSLRDKVERWALKRRTDLMINWERCRSCQHPFYLDD